MKRVKKITIIYNVILKGFHNQRVRVVACMPNSVMLLLSFMLINIVLFSQTKQDTIRKTHDNKIEGYFVGNDKINISEEVVNLKNRLDIQEDMNRQTLGCISDQLEAASYNLSLFTVLFAVCSIFIGFWISHVSKKMIRLKKENEKLLDKNKKIKEDIDVINDFIRNNIRNLYRRLRNEENSYILERLINDPNNVKEVYYTLLSRELSQEDFLKFKQAYLNHNKKDGNVTEYYDRIFIKNFVIQTLTDEILKEKVQMNLSFGIRNSIGNEIYKYTSDFTTVLINYGIHSYREQINSFFFGLTNSQYKESDEVYQIFYDTLKSRINRFDTFNIVGKEDCKRFAKFKFGNLLKDQYYNDNPTKLELLVFAEIEQQKKGENDK